MSRGDCGSERVKLRGRRPHSQVDVLDGAALAEDVGQHELPPAGQAHVTRSGPVGGAAHTGPQTHGVHVRVRPLWELSVARQRYRHPGLEDLQQTDGWKSGWMDGSMGGWMGPWVVGCICG